MIRFLVVYKAIHIIEPTGVPANLIAGICASVIDGINEINETNSCS